ncbi:MAG: TlpA disulfide reductase family protein [Tepidisphaeraceae bacterium]
MRRYAAMVVMSLFVIATAVPSRAADGEAASTLTKVGDAAPKFEVQTLDGKAVSTDSLKGKVVLLNFFATWCGPCVQEMPHLQALSETYKDKPVVVLSIAREQGADEVKKFVEQKKLTFTIALDPKREAYKQFATMYIPRSYVLDRDGKIVFQTVGFSDTTEKDIIAAIEKSLEKTASAAAHPREVTGGS